MNLRYMDGLNSMKYMLYALAGIFLFASPFPEAQTVGILFLVVGVLLAAFIMGVGTRAKDTF